MCCAYNWQKIKNNTNRVAHDFFFCLFKEASRSDDDDSDRLKVLRTGSVWPFCGGHFKSNFCAPLDAGDDDNITWTAFKLHQ